MNRQLKNNPGHILYAIGFLPLIFVSAGLLLFHNVAVTFVLYHAVICVGIPLIYNRFVKGDSAGTSTPKNSGLLSVLLGILLGAVFYKGIYMFFTYFSNHVISKEHVQTLITAWGIKAQYMPLFFVYFAVGNSIIEEIFWRGFFLGKISEGTTPNKAAIITSIFFVQYHFITVWLIFSLWVSFAFLPLIFVASYLWCRLSSYFKNIYAAVVSHLLVDLALMAVLYRFVIV